MADTSWVGQRFEDNGDSYIGGFKRQLTEDTSFLYTSAFGRFNDDPASLNSGERGAINSFILTLGTER